MKVCCQWCGKDIGSQTWETWGVHCPVKVEVKAGQVQHLYSLCDSCAEKLLAELDDRILRHVPLQEYTGLQMGVWTGTKWTTFGAAVDISGPAPNEERTDK